MRIEIEQLIEIIVREVIAELSKLGVTVVLSSQGKVKPVPSGPCKESDSVKRVDMRAYRTPVLTEGQLASLDSNTVEIVIPKGTVITLVAREMIKKKNLTIITNS